MVECKITKFARYRSKAVHNQLTVYYIYVNVGLGLYLAPTTQNS